MSDEREKPHIWTGKRAIEVAIFETDEITSLHLREGEEVLIVDLMSIRDYSVKYSPAENVATPEPEKVIKLRGRFGIPFRVKSSPTGGTMAVSSFAEHPNRAVWSYSNTLPQKPEKDTVWWPVAAFDERVDLAKQIAIGKEYDIACYIRSWTEAGKDGQEKTVEGLYLLEAQQFVRRSQREVPQ